METPDNTEQIETQIEAPRARHGCVTAWLVVMIIANSIVVLAYFFMGYRMSATVLVGKLTTPILLTFGVIGVLNVIFAVMLLQWKKIAFWGFLITSIITFGINLYIGFGIVQCLLGFAGVGILYGILQLETGSRTTWQNLE